jgi:hypothetical protein
MPPSSETTATRRSKKVRPSFDVARAELGGHSDAWVYRSDAPSPVAARATPPVESSTAPRVEPFAAPQVEPSAAPRVGPSAPAPKPARSEPGWIETGVGILAMPLIPLTLTMLAMIAPVLWISGSRPRR